MYSSCIHQEVKRDRVVSREYDKEEEECDLVQEEKDGTGGAPAADTLHAA